jgi:type II secretory pathway pseudopilin PulG
MNIKFLKFQNPPPTSESGYTILEGIMAILMVTVMLTLVGPVIAFSVGTRVQAKRIELASQAAKAYVDSLRAGSLPPPVDNNLTDTTPLKKRLAPNSGQADGGVLDCDNNGFCNNTNTLYCVSFDGKNITSDGKEKNCSNESLVDMVVQAQACYPGDPKVPNKDDGYHLLVRVYRANAFGKLTDGFKTNQNGKTVDSSVTNALGNPALPLTTFTTYIVPTADNAFNSFQASAISQKDNNCLKEDPSP